MEYCFYKNNSTLDDVLSHLHRCDLQFEPPLSSQVELNTYAAKIFENAYRYEAWLDKVLVGLVAVYHSIEHNTGYITYVGVENRHRKNKIAGTLLNTSINEAKNQHIESIELQVSKNNAPAISLYKKFEFHEIRSDEKSFFMMKKLPPSSS